MTSANFLGGFWTPSLPLPAYHKTHQYRSFAKIGDFSTPSLQTSFVNLPLSLFVRSVLDKTPDLCSFSTTLGIMYTCNLQALKFYLKPNTSILDTFSPGGLWPDPPEREHAERERHAGGHGDHEAGGGRARPALPQHVQHLQGCNSIDTLNFGRKTGPHTGPN